LCRTFVHVFAVIAERLAPSPPQATGRRKQGKGGHDGGWSAYVRKVPRKPGIAAVHHEHGRPERATGLKAKLRAAYSAASRKTETPPPGKGGGAASPDDRPRGGSGRGRQAARFRK